MHNAELCQAALDLGCCSWLLQQGALQCLVCVSTQCRYHSFQAAEGLLLCAGNNLLLQSLAQQMNASTEDKGLQPWGPCLAQCIVLTLMAFRK